MSEPYRMVVPVSDVLADDGPALADLEAKAVGAYWIESVTQAGGESVDWNEPESSHQENLHYLMPITGPDGEDVLGEDGEPVLDHTKFFIHVSGYANRAWVSK
jgi:hypothetical protein